MEYHFKIHKEKDGYWAECLELEHCFTEADTRIDLDYQMHEVLNLFLSEPHDSKVIFPLPLKSPPKQKNIVPVKVSSSVAFAYFMRKMRIEKKLTLREMANILNYKSLNSYVKLEKPQTANPELRTLEKILKVFENFPINQILK